MVSNRQEFSLAAWAGDESMKTVKRVLGSNQCNLTVFSPESIDVTPKRQSVKYNVLFFLAIPHTVTQREAVIAGVLVTTHLVLRFAVIWRCSHECSEEKINF